MYFGVGAGDEGLDFGEGGHAGVAGGGHGEGAVGGAEVESLLGVAGGEEAVDEAGDEAVARTDAVEDVEAGVVAGAVEFALMPGEGAPVVDAGGVDAAESGGDRLQIGILFGELGHEGAEGGALVVEEVGGVGISGAGFGWGVGEDADHDVDVGGEAVVEVLGGGEPAAFLPEGGAVVEVVGDGDAVAFGGFAGFDGEFGGAFGEAGEDAAGVEPFAAGGGEEGVPVDVAGLHLGGGAVSAVDTAFGAADTEAAFGEVDGVADAFAHAVVGDPVDVGGVDAALEDEVFDEAADFVVGEGGQNAGGMAEATAEAAGDVVFAAAFPGGEVAGGANAAFTGVETEEDFTEGEEIEGHDGGMVARRWGEINWRLGESGMGAFLDRINRIAGLTGFFGDGCALLGFGWLVGLRGGALKRGQCAGCGERGAEGGRTWEGVNKGWKCGGFRLR